MTINELEQGIRNLIASQPMAVAGPNGDVINGINSLIDAFRNLSFRVQSYPCQDVMKFGLANESAKLENTLSNLACQVLQERGINIMLYIPRNGAGYGSMVNNFGVVGGVDPSMMMGQMMYNANQFGQMPSMMGHMPNAMPNTGRAPAYNQMQPQMMGVSNTGYARPSRQSAPTFPGYISPDRPVKLEPTQTTVQSMKTRTAPQSKIKPVTKAATAATTAATVKNETAPIPEPAPEIPVAPAPSPAEMMMGGGGGDGKAKGRDYLMELLKK